MFLLVTPAPRVLGFDNVSDALDAAFQRAVMYNSVITVFDTERPLRNGEFKPVYDVFPNGAIINPLY